MTPPASGAPYVTTTAAPAAKRSTWWIVPLVIVGLVLVAWLLLAGLPFRREEPRVQATATTETVAEGTAATQPPQSATIVEVGDTSGAFSTETAPPPPMATATTATETPATAPTPPPVIVEERRPPAPAPAPVRRAPPAAVVVPPPARTVPTPSPSNGERSSEISEDEASATLRSYITSTNYYRGARSECLTLRSGGYKNVGYAFSVWDSCPGGGGSQMLGRWRVDAKTREVFRQQNDGRYLRP